jgi:putative addiction module component (TIGR02574 family)
MTQAELLPQIFSLSSNDQLMIVEAIRNHLAGGVASVDEAEFNAELQRRVDDANQNPGDGAPLDTVMRRLRANR